MLMGVLWGVAFVLFVISFALELKYPNLQINFSPYLHFWSKCLFYFVVAVMLVMTFLVKTKASVDLKLAVTFIIVMLVQIVLIAYQLKVKE